MHRSLRSLAYEKLRKNEELHHCLVYPPTVSARQPKAFFRPGGSSQSSKAFFEVLAQNKGYIPRSRIEVANWTLLQKELTNGSAVEIADPQVNLIDGRVHGVGYLDLDNDRIAVFHTVRRQFHTMPTIDGAYWREKIEAAYRGRQDFGLAASPSSAFRLIHGSKDGIPGLTADVFGNACKVLIMEDGPLYGALHSLYSFLSARGMEMLWIRHVKRKQQFFFGNELLNPLFTENGIEYCHVPKKKDGVQETFTFSNKNRNVRKLLRKLAAGCDVLHVFSGEGHSVLATLHGSPRSVVALENRSQKIDRSKSLRGLSESKTLQHIPCTDMLATLADLDSEGFQVVDINIPQNPNDLLASGADSEKASPKHSLVNEMIFHASRCCAPSGYMLISAESRLKNSGPWCAQVAEAARLASARLLRPIQIVQTIYAGQDFPTGPFILSGEDASEYDRNQMIVGYLFRVH